LILTKFQKINSQPTDPRPTDRPKKWKFQVWDHWITGSLDHANASAAKDEKPNRGAVVQGVVQPIGVDDDGIYRRARLSDRSVDPRVVGFVYVYVRPRRRVDGGTDGRTTSPRPRQRNQTNDSSIQRNASRGRTCVCTNDGVTHRVDGRDGVRRVRAG
jgi:hypothetical protein